VSKRSLAVAATAGPEFRSAAVPAQVSQRVIAHQQHVAAAATVSPIGTASRDMRFTPKAQAAVTAGAGLDMDTRSILH
jgi:hypothetical protein